jgi:predicted nucleic acid-binding protein
MLVRYGAEGMTNRHALAALGALQARPDVQVCDEPPGAVALWHRLATRDTASPKVWMDAYLAAFAISGKLALVTLDSDFKMYEAHGLALQLLAN